MDSNDISDARKRLQQEIQKQSHQSPGHEEEARIRWGRTDKWKESQRKTSLYTEEDWQHMREDQQAVIDELVHCMKEGLPPGSFPAMNAAQGHANAITKWFYTCDHDMHTQLADMYLVDPRFTEHYESIVPGLTQYLHDAIWANAVFQLNGELSPDALHYPSETPADHELSDSSEAEHVIIPRMKNN